MARVKQTARRVTEPSEPSGSTATRILSAKKQTVEKKTQNPRDEGSTEVSERSVLKSPRLKITPTRDSVGKPSDIVVFRKESSAQSKVITNFS